MSLLLSLIMSVTSSVADAQVDPEKSGARWMAVPNVAFDADDGLGFGVRAELAIDDRGLEPYETGWVVHAFASLRGFHHHRLRYDRLGLGPDGRFRLTIHLAWRQWLNDGYWGIGNQTLRERRYVGEFSDQDSARKRFRYSLFQPFLHTTLRARIDGPWSVYGAVTGKYSTVDAYADSLLEEEQPFGIDGGLTILLQAGLIFDTRDVEGSPTSGVMAELGARVAPPLPGGAGTFGGVMGSIRGFVPLTGWLVGAGRVAGEALFGDIPFYELVHWGGLFPVTGFGGFESIRGLSFGRFRAPGKAMGNFELRASVLDHTLFGEPFVWQLVPYADVGLVFIGDQTRPRGGPTIHPGLGGGIRAIWQKDFVGRIDVGAGLDPIQEESGTVTSDWTLGIYVVFNHTF